MTSRDKKKRTQGLYFGIGMATLAFVLSILPILLGYSVFSSIEFLSTIDNGLKFIKILGMIIAELIAALPSNLFYYLEYYERSTGRMRGKKFRKFKDIIPVLLILSGIVGLGAALTSFASSDSVTIFFIVNEIGIWVQYIVFRSKPGSR